MISLKGETRGPPPFAAGWSCVCAAGSRRRYIVFEERQDARARSVGLDSSAGVARGRSSLGCFEDAGRPSRNLLIESSQREGLAEALHLLELHDECALRHLFKDASSSRTPANKNTWDRRGGAGGGGSGGSVRFEKGDGAAGAIEGLPPRLHPLSGRGARLGAGHVQERMDPKTGQRACSWDDCLAVCPSGRDQP